MKGLHLDHELIFARIGRIKKLWLGLDEENSSDRLLLLDELRLLQRFMEVHHAIEERFLFPALRPIFSQVQNGPHCNLHMMQRVVEPPLAKAISRAALFHKEPKMNQARMLEIEDHNQIGSYLSIPLEEHEAGAIYFDFLHSLLSEAEKARYSAHDLALTVHSYLSLIDQHAAKEDHCLFPQCEELARSQPITIHVPEENRKKWEEERLAFSERK